MKRYPFKVKKGGLLLTLLFFITIGAYLGLKWQSQRLDQQRLQLLKQKTLLLNQTVESYSQAGLALMREISLGEQVVSAFQEKASAKFGEIRFLLQAIQNKSSLPNVEISLLDTEGKVLWGTTSQKSVDPSLVRLGLFGEEHLFIRSGGSFFHHLYLEGIAPIIKKGKVSGLIHLVLPLERSFLNYLREAVDEEIFIFDKDQFQNSSLSWQSDPNYRQEYLSLLSQNKVQSKIKTVFLELSADRTKKDQMEVASSVSLGVLPLRGQGAEVVAMLVVMMPEKGIFSYRESLEKGFFWFFCAITLFMLIRLIVFFALKVTTLTPRTNILLFLGTVLALSGVWIGTKGLEAYLQAQLEGKNQNQIQDLGDVFKEYNTYVLNSIGEEREALQRQFVRFLQGDEIQKPSQYEFLQLPLGLKKKSVSRVTDSHVPVRWSGTGIFSQKTNDPFSTETGVYKVPVGRFAQKLWIVYSSAWGYPNKFGSPYGTKIGSVQLHFENGNALQVQLENGVNIHDRFFPLGKKQRDQGESKKAFEFISEEDPLTRLQYVEELEFEIPPIYADSKIDYLIFEDLNTPDIPVFYAVTLATKKVPAFPAQHKSIQETEKTIKLKEPYLTKFKNSSLIYYQDEQIAEYYFQDPNRFTLAGTRAPEHVVQNVLRRGKPFLERTLDFGFPAVVTYWPIKEKEFDRPWGMMALVTPADLLENLNNISNIVQSILFVFLLLLGVVVLANVIVSWRKLRFKLVSYSLLVSFVPLLLGGSLLGYLLWQQEKQAAQTRVIASLDQSKTFFSDVKRRAEDVALFLSDREDLLELMEKKESEPINKLLNEVKLSGFSDLPGSFVVVKYSQGTEQTQQWSSSNYSTHPYSVKRLLENSSSGLFFNQVAALVLGFSQIALSDIQQQENQGQLSVYVGVPVDATFLAEMKRRIGTDLAFYSADNLRATTLKFSDLQSKQQLSQIARKHFSTLIKEGKDQFDFIRFEQEGEKASFFQKTAVGVMPLKDDQNRLVGITAAFSDYNQSFISAFSSRKLILFVSIFILALAGLMSYIISRSITKPISALSKKANLIAQGKLGTLIHSTAKDEIGNLTDSFNHMSSSLKDNHDRLEQKISDLITMQRLSSRVSSVLEKEELMHLIVKLFCELSSFGKGMLLVRDPDEDHFIIESSLGIRKSEMEKTQYLPEETLAGLAVKEKSIIFIENHLTDNRIPAESQHRKSSQKPMMLLALPLMAKGKELGAVVLERSAEHKKEVRVDEVMLMTLANHAAIALENAHLYEMAVEDGLTKVFVNRYFQFRLQEEVEHAKRYKTHLSLVLIDLDSFKPINDNYGHQVGDQILVRAAQLMKKTFRSTDVVCRYGGDEFAVILPKTKGEEAVLICERLRREVEKIGTTVDPNIIVRVTFSIGVASWESSMDKEAFIKAADNALYASKTAGRNRVSRHEVSA